GGRPAFQAPHPTAAIGLPPGVQSFGGRASAPIVRPQIGNHSFGSFGHGRARVGRPLIVPPFGFGFYSPFSTYPYYSDPFYSDPFYSNTFYPNPSYAPAAAVESPVVT